VEWQAKCALLQIPDKTQPLANVLRDDHGLIPQLNQILPDQIDSPLER
jgi:hypothetical protein